VIPVRGAFPRHRLLGRPPYLASDMGTDFTDLVAWQEAARLAADVLGAARRIRGLAGGSAASQMVRSAESIPANLAEGYGRGLTADGARLLRVARASASELESHLRVAELSGRLPAAVVAPLVAQTRRVRALINGLLRFAAQRVRH
jgi:four helix bundle protein